MDARNVTTNSKNSSSPCGVDLDEGLVHHGFLLPAAVVVFILSCLKERRNLCKQSCSGRPGFQYAVNFLNNYQKRWTFAAVLVGMSNEIIMLFFGYLYFLPDTYSTDKTVKEYFQWTRVFIVMLNVVEISLIYYPMFACITARRHAVANIAGFLYTVAWFTVQIFSRCSDMKGVSEIGGPFAKVWDPIIYSSIFAQLPALTSYLILLFSFAQDFHYNRKRQPPPENQNLLINVFAINKKVFEKPSFFSTSLQMNANELYVKNLFNGRQKRNTSLFRRFIAQFYDSSSGFLYSTRLICTMCCAGVLLFQMWLVILGLEVFLFNMLDFYFESTTHSWDVIRVEFQFALVLSFVFQCGVIVRLTLSYKKHMLRLYRGDKSWCIKTKLSPSTILNDSLKYMGYQLAYFLWGFLVFFGVFYGFILFMTYIIILPIIHGTSNPIINLVRTLWPTFVVSLVIRLLQLLAVKFCFLYGRGKELIVNNRRVFHALNFILIFYTAILGLYSCLLTRLVVGIVVGLVTISFLDRSNLMRKMEALDRGYRAYLGMLMLDVTYNHPVMLVFLDVLCKAVIVSNNKIISGELMSLNNRARNRWFKAYFLIRNPNVLFDHVSRRPLQNRVSRTWIETGNVTDVDTRVV